jgi:hypothetical protein
MIDVFQNSGALIFERFFCFLVIISHFFLLGIDMFPLDPP